MCALRAGLSSFLVGGGEGHVQKQSSRAKTLDLDENIKIPAFAGMSGKLNTRGETGVVHSTSLVGSKFTRLGKY